MKKLGRMVALILTFSLLLASSAFAATKASSQILKHSIDITANKGGEIAIEVSVTGNGLMKQIGVCKSFFSKVLKLLAFQGVWMFLYSQFPLFFPLSGKNKGKSYCTLSSSFAASRLASLLACA